MHYHFAAADLFSSLSAACFVVAVYSAVAAGVVADGRHLVSVAVVVLRVVAVAAACSVVVDVVVVVRLVACLAVADCHLVLVAAACSVAVDVVVVDHVAGHPADVVAVAANVLCLFVFCCCAPVYVN